MLKKIFLYSFLIVLLALVYPTWYLLTLPDVKQFKDVNPQTSAIRMFREKQTREKGGKPHSIMIWRPLKKISPHLQNAVMLSEDDQFYHHKGFDIESIKRAAKINWERKQFAFGGSTITQQLARTLYLSSHKNLLRKAKEALITRRLERDLSKKRILELYLNVIEWGPQVYGAEAASLYFFQKPAMDLTPEEAIALAVVLPSPRKWDPLSDRKYIANRKKIIYDRMVRAKHIIPPPPQIPFEMIPGTPIPDEFLPPPLYIPRMRQTYDDEPAQPDLGN